jgi:orotidine-5'-phosphate decarboxylase
VLARTSNPGAADLQERLCDHSPLYLRVARLTRSWGANAPGEAGLVVGATAPAAMVELRAECPTLPFLIPGLGAQGGDVDAVLSATATPDGPVLINSSRAILYAGEQPGATLDDYARAAADATDAFRRQLGTAR